MNTPQKMLLAVIAAIALFVAWALGVGMGRVNGDKAAAHNMTVHNLIILDHLEKGESAKAANWCKGFIVDGSRGRNHDASPLVGFLYFIRYHKLPDLNQRMASKAQQVTESFKPDIIDLRGYRVEATQSGITVEMPWNGREQADAAHPATKPAGKAPVQDQPTTQPPKDAPR